MTTPNPQRARAIPGDPMRRASTRARWATFTRYALLFGGVTLVAVAWALMLWGGPR